MMIQKGFKHISKDAQIVFKKILQALSEPGLVIEYDYEEMTWSNLYPTTTSLFLSLCDTDTTIAGDPSLLSEVVKKSLAFHTQSSFVALNQASFVLFDENVSLDVLKTLEKGTAVAPEKNCTVIIQCSNGCFDKLNHKNHQINLNLKGPGILKERLLDTFSLDEKSGIVQYFIREKPKFPMGLDFIFTTPSSFIGLSRTTQVEIIPCM